MKKLIFFLIAFGFSQAAYSKSIPQILIELSPDLNVKTNDIGKCKYTRKELNNVQLNAIFNTVLKDRLSHLEGQDLDAYWNCIFLRRNFKRDTKGFYIGFHQLDEAFSRVIDNKKVKVKGKIRYVGFVPKKYRYDLEYVDGVITAVIKIHFKYKKLNRAKAESIIEKKIFQAQNIWNNQLPSKYKVRFEIVDKPNLAYFSVKLLGKKTRGPYDSKWSVLWSPNTIAHEFGHMFGLDDEYDQVSASSRTPINDLFVSRENRRRLGRYLRAYVSFRAFKCNQSSFMCNSGGGEIKDWHIYTIFKRFFQAN